MDNTWRLYNVLTGTSIMCETREECEHLINKWSELEKKSYLSYLRYRKDIMFIRHIDFIEKTTLAPFGWITEVKAKIYLDHDIFKYAHTQTVCKWVYYHDNVESYRKENLCYMCVHECCPYNSENSTFPF